ncbi:MAG: HD domain-containing protein [Actinobacteria bacterium]|nr:HD domain-containing protein [Actinomycetota bacterium]
MPASIAPPPDTALAAAAEALLVESSPTPLVNHCRRTYVFGAALLERRGRSFDAEALYVAALLHDLGLTDRWDDGVTPFEQLGGRIAATELVARGARPELATLVHDAIALHLELEVTKDHRPEVAGIGLGSAVDVLGLRLDQLPGPLVAEALERFPRLGVKAFLVEAISAQARVKPTSRIALHVERFPFTDLIVAAPFES